MKKIVFIVCMFFVYPSLGYATEYNFQYEKVVNYNKTIDDTYTYFDWYNF